MDKHQTPYGGYSLGCYEEYPRLSQETIAFACDIRRDGKIIGQAHNDGHGGCNSYSFEDMPERTAFFAYALCWTHETGQEFAGIEDDAQFINRLAIVAQMNRRRAVMFVLDGDDFWNEGTYHEITSKIPCEAAIAHLRTQMSDQHPRLWSKERGDFVAV